MSKALSIFALVASVLAARAEDDLYFRWMIDQSEADSRTRFAYAMISVTGGGVAEKTYLTVEDPENPGGWADTFAPSNPDSTGLGTMTLPAYSSLAQLAATDVQALSFALELYNADWVIVGSKTVTFEDVAAMGAIYQDMNTTGITPYVFTADVPEPTGGLLGLLGFALLALRRKRMGV